MYCYIFDREIQEKLETMKTDKVCEEYWKEIDGISSNNIEKSIQAMQLLVRAYKENRPVYGACQYSNFNKTEAKQLYVDIEEKRAYLCFTSYDRFLEAGMQSCSCEQISVLEMINNVMSKNNVFGFVFNAYTENMVLVPMDMLIGFMLGKE